MKKRIIALFCILTLLISSVSVFADYTDIPKDTNEARIIDIITKLGIMTGYEDGSFKPDQAVTRAEFVTVIKNSVKLWNNVQTGSTDIDAELLDTGGFNWIQYFLGNGYNELELMYPKSDSEDNVEETVKKGLWSDVSEEHWAYENMRAVSILGCISGYPDGTFRPDQTVTYNEAVKIILSLCGYDAYVQVNGGFPEGYANLARRFGLNKAITTTGDNPISRMEVAVLIYNSFTVKLTNPLIQSESDKNFLNDIVGVYTLEGTLEGTDLTTIYSSNGLKANTAKVAGTEFTFDAASDLRDYIGREVRVFLKKTDDEYIMQTFEATNGDDVTVIDIDLFKNYANDTFYYKKSADSNTEKSVKVRVGSKLIFNGEYMGSYDRTTFEDLNKGTITIIQKDDYDFDIIVIENYQSGYVESINVGAMEIVDILKAETTGDAMITLKNTDVNEPFIYTIIDENGNKINIEDMAAGAINYYRGPNVAKIFLSSKKVSGQILSVESDADKVEITVGENRYALSDAYKSFVGDTLRNGVSMEIHLDTYGEVVWMKDEISMSGYGYLIKVMKDIENSCLKLRFFDVDNKAINEMYTQGEVRYIDKYGVSAKIDYADLYNVIRDYTGVIKLSYDADGFIKKIEMPLDKSVDGGETLKEVLNGTYLYMSGSYGGKYYLDGNTIVLNIPDDREDYENYSIITTGQIGTKTGASNNSARSVILYNFDDESPFAKLAVTYQVKKADTTSISPGTMYYVLGMADSIDEDNEPIKEITAYNFSSGAEVKLQAEVTIENGVEISPFDSPLSAYRLPYDKPVERGDIINVGVDSNTGMVGVAVMLYDANEVNPAWCTPENANLGISRPTACLAGHTHNTDIMGTIPGTHGFAKTGWELNSSNSTSSSIEVNPFQYNSYGIYHYSNDGRYHRIPGNQWSQFTLGFVYANKEGLLRVTTQNLRDTKFDGTESSEYSWVYENPKTKSAKVYIVEDGEIRVGSINDIRTYKQVGAKCDKVFTYGNQGLQRVIVLRD